eukprot:1403104-Amphidinium_carterae.1
MADIFETMEYVLILVALEAWDTSHHLGSLAIVSCWPALAMSFKVYTMMFGPPEPLDSNRVCGAQLVWASQKAWEGMLTQSHQVRDPETLQYGTC